MRPKRPHLRRTVRELLAALEGILCPPRCPACAVLVVQPGPCNPCREQLSVRHRPWCRRCGSGLAIAGDPCRRDHRPLAGIALARAPFHYRGAAGEAVRRGKFQRDQGALAWLARGMAACLADWSVAEGRRGVLVSVPLYARKRRRRGLDQAAFLADLVAMRLGLVHVPGALVRRRETLAQGDVRVTSRQQNVAGAFAVRRPRAVAGKQVVLVDDVMTSGSTARECARMLLAAAARQVVLLTAAVAADGEREG